MEATGTLDAVRDKVASVCPRLADPYEAAAIVESLGYTDTVIREELGLNDSREVGHAIYTPSFDQRDDDASPGLTRGARIREELRAIAHTCSLSLIYSLPWIAGFMLERQNPMLLQVPPEAAAPLGVALMASLIVSGGFVQCIARKGRFYAAVEQEALGAIVCRRIWQVGAIATTAVALGATLVALYFGMFQPRYLLLATAHFAALSLLWMTCAILLLERGYWQVPTVFAGAALGFVAMWLSGSGALASQTAATVAALGTAGFIVLRRDQRFRKNQEALAEPHYGVLARALAPFFLYGAGYFAFIFADRIAAGTAVATSAAIEFAIDPEYKLGMDLALLLFLLSMSAVEYVNHTFMRFWRDHARRWTIGHEAAYAARLQRRCHLARLAVVLAYLGIATIIWFAFDVLALMGSDGVRHAFLLGAVGYLVLEVALFNALVLFSVSEAVAVVRSLAPALLLNAAGGYVTSHLFGPTWAAAAMLAGALVFVTQTDRELRMALARPGHGCYVA